MAKDSFAMREFAWRGMPMAAFDGPTYMVLVSNYDLGGNWSSRVVQADRAFTIANEYFEQMKIDPEARRLRFKRLDGDAWVWVEKPLKRNAAGEWVKDW
jgi:hypothetical protein